MTSLIEVNPSGAVLVTAKEKARNSYLRSKTEGKVKNRYNQVMHLTRDTIWKRGKNSRKHHPQERKRPALSQQTITMLQRTDKTVYKGSKGAKIRNRYNQVQHLTQDTNGKVKLTVDTTNEGQEVSPFPAGDHKAHINRRAQNIANTRQNKNIKDPQKKYRLGTVSKIFYWRA